jgi:hypothetical protein
MTKDPGGARGRRYSVRMHFEARRRSPTPHDDAIAGTRPALLFALALGVIAGGTAVVLFAAGSALIAHFGGVGAGTQGLLLGAATWLAFWIGLSAGLAGGLALGYRVWASVAGQVAPRPDLPLIENEEDAAVREAEALLRQAAHRHDV